MKLWQRKSAAARRPAIAATEADDVEDEALAASTKRKPKRDKGNAV